MIWDRVEQLEVAVFHLFKRIAHMNAQIASLATQVAATVASEAAAISALKALADKIDALSKQLADAIANGLSPEDVAALTKAVEDLAASATALSAATPVVA